MRCKNCGADNNDNRYICEVCGSPLYDEEETQPLSGAQDNERTQVFSAVKANRQEQTTPSNQNDSSDDEVKNDSNKKGIIIIAVLSVILVAIIVSVIAIAHNNNNKETTSESELTKISTTDKMSTTDKSTTEQTTDESTTKPTTTEKPTTQPPVKWIINASSSGGGEVEGDGEYSNGDKVTLIARADDGYVFDGWYSNGIKVSDSTKYTFSANENASFSAVFNEVETEPVIEEPVDNPDGGDNGDNDVSFGD